MPRPESIKLPINSNRQGPQIGDRHQRIRPGKGDRTSHAIALHHRIDAQRKISVATNPSAGTLSFNQRSSGWPRIVGRNNDENAEWPIGDQDERPLTRLPMLGLPPSKPSEKPMTADGACVAKPRS